MRSVGHRPIELVPARRQTLLFSATMPPPIQKLAAKFLNDPKRVEVPRPATANVNIDQRLVEVKADRKREKYCELRIVPQGVD